jgi:uncharacterized glyoxalase superfamily protein PhnB
MQIQLHHVHIFASNMKATLEFWQQMFDAEILFDMEIAGARNVMLSIGGGKINIYDQPPRESGGGAYHHLGIQTDDLDALINRMESRGFKFKNPVREFGYLKYTMAAAPDNILLELFQVIPEKAPPEKQEGFKRSFIL